MKHEWQGVQEKPGGWATFTTNGVSVRIYFSEFADYWRVVGIIDHEVKRRVANTIQRIRNVADQLEEET